jgi:VanZ family protein
LSLRRWLPALVCLAVVFTLTSIPNPSVPQVPGGDKVAHVIMYGVFGATVTFGLAAGPHTARRLVLAFLATAAIAALDEWHQSFIPGRSAAVSDWVADVTGAGIILLASGVHWWRRESR